MGIEKGRTPARTIPGPVHRKQQIKAVWSRPSGTTGYPQGGQPAPKGAADVGRRPERHAGVLKAAIPVAEKANPKHVKVDMPTLDAVGLDDDFEALGDEIVELMRRRKRLDDEIEAKREAALIIMSEKRDDESWSARKSGEWIAMYSAGSVRETLVKEKLIQVGVTMDQIKRATKTSKTKPSVSFRESKEEA